MRKKVLAGLAAVGALLGACEGGEDRVAAGTAPGTSELAAGVALVPVPAGMTRALDPDRLSPTLTVDGERVGVERRGVSWIASFALAPPREAILVAEWRYRLDDGSELLLARSEALRIGGTNPVRSIVVSDYATRAFDADEDGIDNLTEIVEGSDPTLASTTARVFELELEVPELALGVVASDDLIVEAELDGRPIELSREGDRWVGSFAIDDGVTHRYGVSWSTLVRGAPLLLLTSPIVTFSRGTPNEELRTDVYADSPHDADGDGLSNLAEIFEGSDPLVADGDAALPPGEGQGDCRHASIADGPLFRVGTARDESVHVLPRGDGASWSATFYAERAGTLRVEHRGGEPERTRARLVERRADVAASEGPVRVLADSDDARGGSARARLVVDIERGIHCYELVAVRERGERRAAPLRDTVVRVVFAPREAR